jgi:hypothetical protein
VIICAEVRQSAQVRQKPIGVDIDPEYILVTTWLVVAVLSEDKLMSTWTFRYSASLIGCNRLCVTRALITEIGPSATIEASC